MKNRNKIEWSRSSIKDCFILDYGKPQRRHLLHADYKFVLPIYICTSDKRHNKMSAFWYRGVWRETRPRRHVIETHRRTSSLVVSSRVQRHSPFPAAPTRVYCRSSSSHLAAATTRTAP